MYYILNIHITFIILQVYKFYSTCPRSRQSRIKRGMNKKVTQGRIHKTFFFVTYEWAKKLECLSLAGLSNLV